MIEHFFSFRSHNSPQGPSEPKKGSSSADALSNPDLLSLILNSETKNLTAANWATAYTGENPVKQRRVYQFMRELAKRPCKDRSELYNLETFLRIMKDEKEVSLKSCLENSSKAIVTNYLLNAQVEILDLSNNPRFDFSALNLPKKLTKLNLAHNKLGVKGAEALALAIRDSDSLTSLNLADNNLMNYGTDMTGIKVLSSAIRDSGSLTSIDLAHNFFCPEGAKALAPAIRSGSLTSINLAGNFFDAEAAKALAPAIRDSGSLTSLNLAQNLIGGYYNYILVANPEGTIALAEAIAVSRSLTSLDLANNALHAEGAKALVDGGAFTGSLTSVGLLSNDLDAETVTMLLKVKEEHPKLKTLCGFTHEETELDLSNKGLGPADAMLMTPELGVIASLTSLNLGGNSLCGIDENGDGDHTVEGISALSEAIRVGGSLTRLNLWYNDLRAEGAKALVDGGAFTGSLTELDIQGNEIGEDGAQAIADCLQMNASCALKKLIVPDGIENHENLKAACQLRGVKLI